jgi:hypothetical protein
MVGRCSLRDLAAAFGVRYQTIRWVICQAEVFFSGI